MPFYPNLGSTTAGGGEPAPSGPDLPDVIGILPEQAWVDNIESLTGYGDVDLHNKDITFIEPTLVTNIFIKHFFVSGGAATSLNLSGNALPTENVDDVLTAALGVATGYSIVNCTINLDGADMGAPTPVVAAAPQVDGVLQLNFELIAVGQIYVDYRPYTNIISWHFAGSGSVFSGVTVKWMHTANTDHEDGEGAEIFFDPTVPFNSSSQSGVYIVVGVQDDPTNADMVLFLMSCNLVGNVTGAGQQYDAPTSELILSFVDGSYKTEGDGWTLVQAFRANTRKQIGTLFFNDAMIEMWFDPSVEVVNSAINIDGTYSIGLIGNESHSYLQAITDLINGNTSLPAVLNSTTITITTSNSFDLPLSGAIWAQGESVAAPSFSMPEIGALGVIEQRSALIDSLVSAGWSGTYQSDAVGMSVFPTP